MIRILKILFFTLVLFQSSIGSGQWRRVLNCPGSPVYSVYFLDDSSGVPIVGFVALKNQVWRTSDGGSTWTKVSDKILTGSQFAFKDSLIGWCADRGGNLFMTMDGGWTWSTLSVNHRCEGVYYNNISKRLFYASWGNGSGAAYSDNDGFTWTQIVDDKYGHNTVEFTSGNNGIINSISTVGEPFLMTNDGGLTWSQLPFAQESWQILGIWGTNTYFAACEATGSGLNRTDDGGITWHAITSSYPYIQSQLTGDIHGDLCRMYLQTYGSTSPAQSNGIYRSVDEGESWQFIGGPGNWFDRRFYCKGKYICAGDTLGGVWLLHDTLPVSLISNLELSSSVVNFDTVPRCSEPEIKIRINNHFTCYATTITKLEWAFPATNPFLVVPPTSNSRILGSKSEDSIVIKFPNTITGSFNSKLKISMIIDGRSYDTSILVRG